MTNNQEIDKNFSGRLNILRAGVLGANDGIISIAGVVIGVASATESVWIIFLSGLAAVFAGALSMAGGEYVSVSTQKDCGCFCDTVELSFAISIDRFVQRF